MRWLWPLLPVSPSCFLDSRRRQLPSRIIMAPWTASLTSAVVWSCLFHSIWAKLVRFEVVLTWQRGSPDGVNRQMILMNGQFPGPVLELDYGDDVEFTMINQLPFNCAIHFHGIE